MRKTNRIQEEKKILVPIFQYFLVGEEIEFKHTPQNQSIPS